VVAKQVPIIVINSLLALLLLYYASMQIPILGLLLGALMPLPTIMTIRRAGWLPGVLLVLAGLGIMFYVEHFSGIRAEVLPFLHMAVIGFAMSFFIWRRDRLEVIVGGTVILVVTLQALTFLVLAWQQGVTPLVYLQRIISEVWKLFSQLVANEPALKQEMQFAGVNAAEITSVIAQLTPALLLINATLVVLLNYLLSRRLGGARECEDSRLSLSAWEAPGWLVFVLIGAGFFLLVPNQVVQMVGVNVLLVCSLFYFFQGLAILGFHFKRFRVPQFFRWIAYTLLVLIKSIMLLVILMGLIDLWLDFRHLHRPPSEA
jgi:uncharacterized protein YybS (DUF2232 family)